MKRIRYLVLFQAILSLMSGYLISKMSFIGRLGINLFYSEYKIFKSWWETALLLFAIQLLVIGILFIKKRKESANAKWISILLLLISLIGLYATYNDFQHTFSHKLLKEKFHLGFYLFWLSWMGSCIYFLVMPATQIVVDGELKKA